MQYLDKMVGVNNLNNAPYIKYEVMSFAEMLADPNGFDGKKTVCPTDHNIYIYDPTYTSSETGHYKAFVSGQVIQLSSMPIASAYYLGKVVQYIGATTNGYQWEEIPYTSGLESERPETGYYRCTDSLKWYKDNVDITSQVTDCPSFPQAEASLVGTYAFNYNTNKLGLCVYVGAYIHNYFYECILSEGVYSWVNVIVEPQTKVDNESIAYNSDNELEVKNGGISNSKLDENLQTAVAQIGTNTTDIATINGKISSQASSSNKLMSETEVDEKVALVEARQIYATATQGNFASKSALDNATTFYNASGTAVTLTKNDVTYVLADETKDDATTKYTVASVNPVVWAFVVKINDKPFTQAQMNAINSGANALNIASIATKSTVSVSASGTATDEIEYITIDGTQKKIKSGQEIQFEVMPMASNVWLGKIIQYTGATTSGYVKGYYYLCMYDTESTLYYWVQRNTQPASTGGGGNIDGGVPDSTYLPSDTIDGGYPDSTYNI